MRTIVLAVLLLVAAIAGTALLPLDGSAPEPARAPAAGSATRVQDQEATILFVGDMSFDRYLRQKAEQFGSEHLFSCIDPLLGEADVVVGNLEGPITDHASVSAGSVVGSPANFRFTFPPETAPLLHAHGIRIVNLGNNHIRDFGTDGIASTRAYLGAAGVASFGGIAGDEPPYRTELAGVPVSFVSYNQFGGGPAEAVAGTIAAERAAGRTVIVYTHWGEEYMPPTPRVRETARLFAESGASLVVGSHPHVIQERETISTTPVYYSLGNFIFDQYWNEEVSTGLVLRVTVSADGITVEEERVRMGRDGRTCLVVA